MELAEWIEQRASSAGFQRCGIARAEPIGRGAFLRDWLAAGRAGSMAYLHRCLEERANPALLLEGARSVIVFALSYRPCEADEKEPTDGYGRIARYAWGEDYHTVLKDKLFALVGEIRAVVGENERFKVCVDTAPLLEREVAAAAGIGWIGKNTLILDAEWGSYLFLGAVITTLDLPADDPVEDHCGTCTACLDACPTGALDAPYQMDAAKCISYLTIEHRDAVSESLVDRMGSWLFGCDICQEVCPHNRHAPATSEPRFAPRPPAPAIAPEEVLRWSVEDYRSQLKGSAMRRAKLEMFQRNARILQQNASVGGQEGHASRST